MKKVFLTLCFFTIIPNLLFGHSYLKKLYDKSDGLPSTNIYSIYQGSEGYIWIGTDQGLSRFDGYEFVNYSKPKEIINNPIIDIVQTRENRLLLITKDGNLWNFNGLNILKYSSEKTFLNHRFYSIENSDNQLLVSFFNKTGLYKLYKDSLAITAVKIRNDRILKLKQDRSGNTFITTNKGIFQYKNDSVLPLLINDTVIYRDYLIQPIDTSWYGNHYNKEVHWHTTKEHGIFINYDNFWEHYAGDENSWFTDLNYNSYGEVWASTLIGMFRLIFSNPDYGYLYTELRQKKITSTLIDNNDILWIGAFGKGLYQFTRTSFVNYLFPYGFPGTSATVLFKDDYDDIWFGAKNYGIVKLHPYSLKKYDLRDKYPQPDILCGTKNDSLLIFGGKNILLEFKEGHFVNFNRKGLPSDFLITNLELTSSGNLLALINKSELWEYNTNTWVKKAVPPELYKINNLYSDSNNVIWLCSNQGVYTYSEEIIKKKYFIKDATTMCQPDSNVFWIGTDNGIYVIKNDSITTHFTTVDGLISNNINSISALNDKIFIGSEQGLAIYYNKEFHQFTASLGLISNSISEGKIEFIENHLAYIGTKNGFTAFELRYFDKKLRPICYLNKIATNKDTVTLNKTNELQNLSYSANENDLSFFFGIIDFRDFNKKLRYKVFINNKLKETKEIKSPQVVLKNLEPGYYHVELETNTITKNWELLYTMNFKIKPKWYSTILAYFTYIIILTSLVLILYYLRKQRKQNKYKTSSLSENKAKDIIKQLIILFENDKIYSDPDLSLNTLSEKLNCSKEYISQVINTEFKQNFNSLINRYRVKEAEYLLKNKNGNFSSILEIGFEVGFNSKSAFNTAFKKYTNYTPTEYRKKYN